MSSDIAKSSLLDEDITPISKDKPAPKPTFSKDPMVYIFALACILALIAMAVVQNVFTKQVMPKQVKIAWV